ncbi:MAG TPA: phage capsid protein [Hyphomicrobiaceae bacterium]|jgi:hypothetical protein
MLQNDAWFIHAVSDNVTQLAQQKMQKTRGSYRVREGVVGKTYPFNRIGTVSMASAVRDSDTTYVNPPQSKRRAILTDWAVAALIDEFDEIKMLADPESEVAQIMAYARNRKLDEICLGAALAAVTNVNESAETTSTTAIPAGQQIAAGGTGLTVDKVLAAAEVMNTQDVDTDDRYFFYSPHAMTNLLKNTQVTSSDFNTIQALARGGYPFDQTWMGFYWRQTTMLAKAGNIRSCIAWQKMALGVAVGLITDVKINEAPHKWNNTQVVLKLSAGAARVDDAGVVQVDIDETQ